MTGVREVRFFLAASIAAEGIGGGGIAAEGVRGEGGGGLVREEAMEDLLRGFGRYGFCALSLGQRFEVW